MKHTKALLLAAILATQAQTPAYAVDPLYITGNALLVTDWLQTRAITTDPHLKEGNPLLGAHPAKQSVDLHFLSAIILYNTANYLLPEKHTSWLNLTVTLVEGAMVYHNVYYGVGIDFKF